MLRFLRICLGLVALVFAGAHLFTLISVTQAHSAMHGDFQTSWMGGHLFGFLVGAAVAIRCLRN